MADVRERTGAARVRERLADGPVMGTVLAHLRSPAVAVMLQRAGWDFVVLDTECGAWDAGSLAEFCLTARAAGLPAIARIGAARQPGELWQHLDRGASGLVCRGIERPDEVAYVLGAMQHRVRARPPLAVQAAALDDPEPLLILEVNTPRGIASLETLLRSGVDGVFLGGGELCGDACQGDRAGVGLPGELAHAVRACTRAGVACGAYAWDAAHCIEWMRQGMRVMVLGDEATWLLDGSRRALEEIRRAGSPR